MDQKGICCASQIWNFDEIFFNNYHLQGQDIIVPSVISVVHAPSPMNRQSITMIEAACACGREPPPPDIIILDKYTMEYRLHENFQGEECIIVSGTEYTNE